MISAENGETRIFVMRHGEVIRPQSNPLVFRHQEILDTAVLSDAGCVNVGRTFRKAKEQWKTRISTVIFSSKRPHALLTAKIAKIILVSDNMQLVKAKKGGSFSTKNPEAGWELEARMVIFINLIQREHEVCDVLIMSHAENLSIAQAHLTGLDMQYHQELKFDYGELRMLQEKSKRRLNVLIYQFLI